MRRRAQQRELQETHARDATPQPRTSRPSCCSTVLTRKQFRFYVFVLCLLTATIVCCFFNPRLEYVWSAWQQPSRPAAVGIHRTASSPPAATDGDSSTPESLSSNKANYVPGTSQAAVVDRLHRPYQEWCRSSKTHPQKYADSAFATRADVIEATSHFALDTHHPRYNERLVWGLKDDVHCLALCIEHYEDMCAGIIFRSFHGNPSLLCVHKIDDSTAPLELFVDARHRIPGNVARSSSIEVCFAKTQKAH